MLTITVSCATFLKPKTQLESHEVDYGYNALLLFLDNQQHLGTVRRVKSFLMFQNISDDSAKLIDTISRSSKNACAELEKLVLNEPVVVVQAFSEGSIAKSTFDSLRLTIAKELFLD